MTPDSQFSPASRRFAARRRAALVVVLGAVLVFMGSTLAGSDTDKEPPMIKTSFQEMFDQSKASNKGLMLFVQGQTIPGLVTSYSDEVVEMRSREYARIVVRIDRIDGMAIQ